VSNFKLDTNYRLSYWDKEWKIIPMENHCVFAILFTC